MSGFRNVIFSLIIIRSGGQATGLFIYSGTPASGNPPQFAVVAAGVTTDPFGNAITSSQILVQGNIITESGGVFRTAAAAPLIQLDGPHNALLFYDASAFLAETIAPAATTDGLGNTVQAGFTAYAGSNTTYAQLLAAALRFTQSGFAASPNIGTDASADLVAVSGTTAALASQAGLTLKPAASGAPPVAVLANVLELLEAVAAPAALAGGPQAFGSPATGMARFVSDSTKGDSQQYDTGAGRAYVTSAPVTINSLSQTPISGMSRVLAVGTYIVRGMILATQSAAGPGQQAMGFVAAGGLVASSVDIVGTGWVTQAGIGTALPAFELVSLGSRASIGTPPLNDTFALFWEGTIVVSTAGTLEVAASCVTSVSDTWQVRALSFLEVCPVG